MLATLSTQTLAIAFLVTVAIGGAAWVFLYPLMSGERHVERRRASVTQADPVVRSSVVRSNQKTRREHVEETLKELDDKRKKNRTVPLHVRLTQAGLTWSKRQFILFSAGLGVGAFLLVLLMQGGLLPALGVSFAGACGLPFWILRFLKKRREKKFLAGFPDAVDVIVRGIKAGLPLVDCVRVISNEATEPVRSEFRAIVETQAIGMPLGEACIRLYDRIPLPEANFFGIVISIQQKSGGNLSEALGNL